MDIDGQSTVAAVVFGHLVLFMKKMLKYAEWPDFMCRYYMNTRLCRAGRAWKRLILGKNDSSESIAPRQST